MRVSSSVFTTMISPEKQWLCVCRVYCVCFYWVYCLRFRPWIFCLRSHGQKLGIVSLYICTDGTLLTNSACWTVIGGQGSKVRFIYNYFFFNIICFEVINISVPAILDCLQLRLTWFHVSELTWIKVNTWFTAVKLWDFSHNKHVLDRDKKKHFEQILLTWMNTDVCSIILNTCCTFRFHEQTLTWCFFKTIPLSRDQT